MELVFEFTIQYDESPFYLFFETFKLPPLCRRGGKGVRYAVALLIYRFFI